MRDDDRAPRYVLVTNAAEFVERIRLGEDLRDGEEENLCQQLWEETLCDREKLLLSNAKTQTVAGRRLPIIFGFFDGERFARNHPANDLSIRKGFA